ncbi:MAG: diaminopimelate decarboxylase [Gammaproteobacteria bacterium]
MDHFTYQNDRLQAEQLDVEHLAQTYGTPLYIYSRATLERHWHAFDQALSGRPHLICYAVKANSNIALLALLARLGSGFDIVSIGELERVLRAGGTADRIVFSGVGKTTDEIERALETGIRCFNVESAAELQRIGEIASAQGAQAAISLRVNPDVDAGTHPYISTGLKENKFGIDVDSAYELFLQAADMSALKITGIDCHIGSQLTSTQPFVDALERVLSLSDRLHAAGINIKHLDLGGGLGVNYRDENPPTPAEYIQPLLETLGDRDFELLIEPGRAIAANAGLLVTRIEYLKPTADKNFAIIDAAMNDLLRPSLYNAWQDIIPVIPRSKEQAKNYDVVGPVCETGDFLGKDRLLNIQAGDLLAVRSAGAYGFTMSSNYNSRPRAAEILVDQDRVHLVRERETLDSLMQGEHIPDF